MNKSICKDQTESTVYHSISNAQTASMVYYSIFSVYREFKVYNSYPMSIPKIGCIKAYLMTVE